MLEIPRPPQSVPPAPRHFLNQKGYSHRSLYLSHSARYRFARSISADKFSASVPARWFARSIGHGVDTRNKIPISLPEGA